MQDACQISLSTVGRSYVHYLNGLHANQLWRPQRHFARSAITIALMQRILQVLAVKILISWVGLADLGASRVGDPGDLGPVGLALSSWSFGRAVLLSDQDAQTQRTYIDWVGSIAPTTVIQPEPVNLSSPSAFDDVFSSAAAVVDRLRGTLAPSDELFFYISPGTPVMAATWLILGKTRYHSLGVRYLESSQKRLNELDVPFDLAANILPDVLRVADERLTTRSEGRIERNAGFKHMIYRSPQMCRLVEDAQKAALRSINVLIEGESGTGKELLASAVHSSSSVAAGPFVPVNCGAIPENLVEGELFGHEKGAFTGAVAAKAGWLEAANGGTLFLDEVGELPLTAQVKLLRALQERKVARVGSTKLRDLNIRVVAATNRDLAKEVFEGRFREDLFYRLCVLRLALPPLRERTGDLELLIQHLLDQLNEESAADPNYEPRVLSAPAKQRLLQHSWPGNIRELQNTLQRLVFLADHAALSLADVDNALLPSVSAAQNENLLDRPFGPDFSLRELQAQVARHYMTRALEVSGGRVSRAAALVGTSRQNFSNWMREYEVPEPH